MADNIKGIPFSTEDEGRSFPDVAKDLVYHQAVKLGAREENREFGHGDIYVVWYAYVLGNWKALCSTTVADGRYYEVTYNKDKNEAYVDTYAKIYNNVHYF